MRPDYGGFRAELEQPVHRAPKPGVHRVQSNINRWSGISAAELHEEP